MPSSIIATECPVESTVSWEDITVDLRGLSLSLAFKEQSNNTSTEFLADSNVTLSLEDITVEQTISEGIRGHSVSHALEKLQLSLANECAVDLSVILPLEVSKRGHSVTHVLTVLELTSTLRTKCTVDCVDDTSVVSNSILASAGYSLETTLVALVGGTFPLLLLRSA